MLDRFMKSYGETAQKYIKIMYSYLELFQVSPETMTLGQKNKIIGAITEDYSGEERKFILELLDKYIDFVHGRKTNLNENPIRARLFYELYKNKYKTKYGEGED